GLLTESGRLFIDQSALFNNGRWELQVKDTADSEIRATHNWWGTPQTEEVRVKGTLDLRPILDTPPDFDFVHLWMQDQF
ncbi:MAG: hypothetical protein KGY41_11225, partial [Desulfovermiculus sp.]|nr:hypothetical protein [Desulfovermiculus sp.]